MGTTFISKAVCLEESWVEQVLALLWSERCRRMAANPRDPCQKGSKAPFSIPSG
jgi:hypothetical protein